MSKTLTHDYADLKAFVVLFAKRFLNSAVVPEDSRPDAFLNKLEKTSMKSAEKSLRLSLQDCIGLASSWSAREISDADNFFKSAGIITVSELLPEFSRKYSNILKKIKFHRKQSIFL